MKVDKDGLPNPVAIKMQQNIFKFSGAKSYAQLQELNNALTKNGKILSWNDFKTEALKLNSKYNLNYLQAEYQTAKQAGYHANNWETFQENKKRYPNLKYRTQEDDRVRDEHRALEGLIVPIDHPFWQSYYPPNGWRCRCFVEQTKENADLSIIPETVPDVKEEFRINTGISGQVFKEGENYFALVKDAGKELKLSLELSKTTAEPLHLLTDKGTLTMSIFADLTDLKKNVKSATVAITNIKVQMHINLHSYIDGEKNPEYTINGNLGDRKEIKGYNGITAGFNKLEKQKAVSILFDMMLFPSWEVGMFVRKLKGKLMAFNKRWVKDIIVEHKGKAVMFTADQVIDEPLVVLELLKKIKAD